MMNDPNSSLQQQMQRAQTLFRAGEVAAAEQICRTVLGASANYYEALTLLGDVALRTGRADEAVRHFDRAIAVEPQRFEAYYGRGVSLHSQSKLEAALDNIRVARRLQSGNIAVRMREAHLLRDLGRHDEAVACYSAVLIVQPANVEARANSGVLLASLGRHAEAVTTYDHALRIRPDLAEIHYNRGNALLALGKFSDAVDAYDRAGAVKPDLAQAWHNRGIALQELKRLHEALASYERALALEPRRDWLYGAYLHVKMHLCDWVDHDAHIAELRRRIEAEDRVIWPFPLLALIDSPALHRSAAEIFTQEACPESHALPPITKRPEGDRIHLGYFSTDFHNHAVAFLGVGLYELHDRTRYRVTAFSLGPDSNDEMRQRLTRGFDQFHDVRERADIDVARLARDLGIDIAIDLNAHTRLNRMGIFAHRAAPIQVNFLGYPGTSGAPYMDYLIADRVLVPPSARQHYVEKIVYMPHSYQVNDHRRPIAPIEPAREALGLPADGFVFCCFNNSFKITPTTFGSWMRILRAVDRSVLWLLEANNTVADRLRRCAESRGIDGHRLIFAPPLPAPEHLARQRAAGLFLDTLPYNAHTTASDALWAGVPVLTLVGEAFPGRVAASLLSAIPLPELIATTPEEYESLAIALATDAERLAQLTARLRSMIQTAPLFDTLAFARSIESAYQLMFERYQAGMPTIDIDARKPESAS